MKFFFAFIISLLSLIAWPANCQEISISQDLDNLASITERLPYGIRSGLLISKYKAAYPNPNLDEADAKSLRSRFDSANTVVFYTYDKSIASEMMDIFEILERRGLATADDELDLIGAQAISRNTDSIKSLARSPNASDAIKFLEPLQNAEGEPSKWSALRHNEDGALTLEHYQIDSGNHLIVVASPLCSFSRAASEYISQDKQLTKFFSTYGIWLIPPMRQPYIKQVESWNNSHENQKMVWASSGDKWPIVDDWSTPVFYFVSNGVLIEKITGWPKDNSNSSHLRSAIARFLALK